MAWFKGQSKLTQNGTPETPEEVEAWLISELNKQGKESRQGICQQNVCCHSVFNSILANSIIRNMTIKSQLSIS